MQMVVKAQIPNYLVVAIDTQLRDDLLAKGYNVFYKDITVSLLNRSFSAYNLLCMDKLSADLILQLSSIEHQHLPAWHSKKDILGLPGS